MRDYMAHYKQAGSLDALHTCLSPSLPLKRSSRFAGLPHLLIFRPILQSHYTTLQNLTFLTPFFRLLAHEAARCF